MRPHPLPILVLLASLAACAAPPPPPPPVVVTGPPEATRARLVTALRRLRFTITGGDPATGIIEARNAALAATGWVTCPRIGYDDDTGPVRRWRNATPVPVRAEVALELAGTADGLAVTPRVRFIGRYLDTFTNTARETPCRSTGTLERALARAAAGPQAAAPLD